MSSKRAARGGYGETGGYGKPLVHELEGELSPAVLPSVTIDWSRMARHLR